MYDRVIAETNLDWKQKVSDRKVILCVQEVVTYFISLAYCIKWVTTSWTYCIWHLINFHMVDTDGDQSFRLCPGRNLS